MIKKKLESKNDLRNLRELAQDREQWKKVTEFLLKRCMEQYHLEEKIRLQKKKTKRSRMWSLYLFPSTPLRASQEASLYDFKSANELRGGKFAARAELNA